MAKFMILIFGDEQKWAAMSLDEQRKIDQGHRAFRAAAGTAMLDSGQLEPPAAAATLRSDAQGHLVVMDGPFAETKETVGGYYVVQADDRDKAIALASGLHEVRAGHSWVEVYPVAGHE
jgi:hypothetical protein